MKNILFLLLLSANSVSGQFGDYFLSARSLGMGRTGVTITDEYAALNNPAGVAGQEHPSIVFAIHNYYGISGLNMAGTAVCMPLPEAAILFSVFRFGGRLMNEHKFGAGYAHKIGFVRLGIRVNYLQYRSELKGSSGSIVLEFGGMAELLPALSVGAYIYNPARATIDRENRFFLPVHLKAGLSYHPESKILLSWKIEKTVGEIVEMGVGLEYFLQKKMYLRAGMTLNPARINLGLGLPIRKFLVDYAISIDPVLGISNQLSLVFKK